MSYLDVYRRRLNRYGLDYQSRIQAQRDRNFENYLLKSIYRVDFWYDNIYVPATLERYKQDYTETQCYLLTRRDLVIPNGTVLEIESRDGKKTPWMVWWLEQVEASGYNTYVVLKMTHEITWRDAENNEHTQWAYFYGPGTQTMRDAIKISDNYLYSENNNLHMFITTYEGSIGRDTYFKVPYKEKEQAYVVTETDVNSTPGVVYVTVDPTYVRDEASAPVQEGEDKEFFWLNGGLK